MERIGTPLFLGKRDEIYTCEVPQCQIALKKTDDPCTISKMGKSFRFTFKPVDKAHRELIYSWVVLEQVKEWLHGQGLKNLLDDLEKSFKGASGRSQHWIAYDKDIPFAYLLTSYVEDMPDSQKNIAITLDVFICDFRYLGKGLSHIMIQEFLVSQFPDVKEVIIDPEVRNTRAIRAYEKVGFRIIEEFIAAWHPVPHYKMRLFIKDLLR